MKLKISIPQNLIDSPRKFIHPSRRIPLVLAVVLAFVVLGRNAAAPHWGWKVVILLLLAAGLSAAWMSVDRRAPRSVTAYLWASAFLVTTARHWPALQTANPVCLYFIPVVSAAVFCGIGESLALSCVIILLDLTAQAFYSQSNAPLGALIFEASLLVFAASIAGYATGGLRKKVLDLREEIERVRGTPFAYTGTAGGLAQSTQEVDSPDPGSGIEVLETGIQQILQRMKDYFRAHSVLLYQPSSGRSLTLRHAVSESKSLITGHILEIETSLLGRLFARGISCNWKLEEPGCSIASREIPYYSEWQPVRNLAAYTLGNPGSLSGLLVVDRTSSRPFTDLEMINLETFSIQLVELIQMGRRYLEQVDRNLEYQLFYRAMSELGQSLATGEVLESLVRVCRRVADSSHVIVALQDESGVAYEIGWAYGAEELQGTRVANDGRTWISWMLRSGTEPLLLRDIRSHFSNLPLASPGEGRFAVRSVLLIPLMSKERKLGILLMGSPQPDYYKNWHSRILLSVCQLVSADIENSLLHQRVENEAISDGLTRVHNHRYFQERLKTECSRAKRSGTPLSLLMIDIDYFKKVNDTYGHRVGDSILQQMAGILKSSLRSEDDIARYGGEEFVVILAGSDAKGAHRMAERFRHTIDRTTFETEDNRLKISITIGIATFPGDALNPWELIERADRALYAGKESGRNRVVLFHTIADQVRGGQRKL